MKRLSPERRRRNIIVTRKRSGKRARRKRALGCRTRNESCFRLVAPEKFDLGASLESFTQFLKKLRDLAGRQRRKVRIDFRDTTTMTAPGTLLFAAELDRIAILTGQRLVCCTYPCDNVVAQVLQHVGVFEILGQKRRCDITADNVKYWQFASGTEAEGERVGHALEPYRELLSDPEQKALYRGLTEAMTNCRQHAYVADPGETRRRDTLGTVAKWWMLWQLYNDRLVVAICDLGIGIPESLRRNKGGIFNRLIELIRELKMFHNDGSLIQAAMALGRSSSWQDNRGKGLQDLRAVVTALSGSLRIQSNRGAYHIKDETETCLNFKERMSILGTLVVWEIPLSGRVGAS